MSTWASPTATWADPAVAWSAVAVNPALLPQPPQAVQLVHITLRNGTRYHLSTGKYTDADRRWYSARLTSWVTWERTVGCRLWSRGSRSGVGVVEIANPDGVLNALLTADTRGAIVQVYECLDNVPIEDASIVATAELLSADRFDGRLIRLVTKDPLGVFDVPLQTALYVSGDSVDDSLIGTPKPISLGAPLSVPPVPRSYADQIYDCHDLRDELISGSMLVRDNGADVAFTLAAVPYTGVELTARAIGQVVVDVVTGIGTATDIIDAALGDFASDIPGGWTVDADGGTLAWESPGRARYVGTASQRPSLSLAAAVDAGIAYSWQVQVVDLTVGTLEVRAGGALIEVLDSVKTWSGDFIAAADGDFEIVAAAGSGGIGETPRPEAINAAIDVVRLASLVYGATSARVIQQIAYRIGLDPALISIQSLVSLLVTRPWEVAYYAAAPVQAREVLQQVLDSVLGAAYALPDGRIAIGVLQPPNTGTIALVVSDSIGISEVQTERDDAPGVSVTVAGLRNWRPYQASELVDDPALDSVRAALQADYRTKRRTATAISTELGSRETGEIDTLLSDAADVQTLANLIAELYPETARPRFFTREVASTPAVRALVPFQRVQFDVDGTLYNARLIGIQSSGMRTRLTAWGWM
jgi:hypothetical protein